jgi:ubiquinone/menaquinone biosynthesis C-methylase UbiE
MNPLKTLHLFLIEKRPHVCPTEVVNLFDNRIRNWLIPPENLYGDLVSEGMTAYDLGAGAGVNAIELALLVGPTGKVVAADIQQGMLDKIADRIQRAGLDDRIELHLSEPDCIGLPPESADFIIASMMLHEVPNREKWLKQAAELAKPGARFVILEPPVHVTRGHFEETVRLAVKAGLEYVGRRPLPIVHTAQLRKP